MDIKVFHKMGRVPISVLSIIGDIDYSNHEQLEKIAFQEIEDGARFILIDLAGVRFISSAALRSMMQIFEKLRSASIEGSVEELYKEINAGTYRSPHLKLYKPSRAVAETMKIAGFDMILEIHNNLKAAIASF